MSHHTPRPDAPVPEPELSDAELDDVAGGLATSSGIRLDMEESPSGSTDPKAADALAPTDSRSQTRSGIVLSFED